MPALNITHLALKGSIRGQFTDWRIVPILQKMPGLEVLEIDDAFPGTRAPVNTPVIENLSNLCSISFTTRQEQCSEEVPQLGMELLFERFSNLEPTASVVFTVVDSDCMQERFADIVYPFVGSPGCPIRVTLTFYEDSDSDEHGFSLKADRGSRLGPITEESLQTRCTTYFTIRIRWLTAGLCAWDGPIARGIEMTRLTSLRLIHDCSSVQEGTWVELLELLISGTYITHLCIQGRSACSLIQAIAFEVKSPILLALSVLEVLSQDGRPPLFLSPAKDEEEMVKAMERSHTPSSCSVSRSNSLSRSSSSAMDDSKWDEDGDFSPESGDCSSFPGFSCAKSRQQATT